MHSSQDGYSVIKGEHVKSQNNEKDHEIALIIRWKSTKEGFLTIVVISD